MDPFMLKNIFASLLLSIVLTGTCFSINDRLMIDDKDYNTTNTSNIDDTAETDGSKGRERSMPHDAEAVNENLTDDTGKAAGTKNRMLQKQKHYLAPDIELCVQFSSTLGKNEGSFMEFFNSRYDNSYFPNNVFLSTELNVIFFESVGYSYECVFYGSGFIIDHHSSPSKQSDMYSVELSKHSLIIDINFIYLFSGFSVRDKELSLRFKLGGSTGYMCVFNEYEQYLFPGSTLDNYALKVTGTHFSIGLLYSFDHLVYRMDYSFNNLKYGNRDMLSINNVGLSVGLKI